VQGESLEPQRADCLELGNTHHLASECSKQSRVHKPFQLRHNNSGNELGFRASENVNYTAEPLTSLPLFFYIDDVTQLLKPEKKKILQSQKSSEVENLLEPKKKKVSS
jgi:hypothetical protein